VVGDKKSETCRRPNLPGNYYQVRPHLFQRTIFSPAGPDSMNVRQSNFFGQKHVSDNSQTSICSKLIGDFVSRQDSRLTCDSKKHPTRLLIIFANCGPVLKKFFFHIYYQRYICNEATIKNLTSLKTRRYSLHYLVKYSITGY